MTFLFTCNNIFLWPVFKMSWPTKQGFSGSIGGKIMFNFRKKEEITEGNFVVKIVGAEVVSYPTNDALKLNVMTKSGAAKTFLIFENNSILIERLIEATSLETTEQSFDESCLVGRCVSIETRHYKEYLNICDFTAAEGWESNGAQIEQTEDIADVEI